MIRRAFRAVTAVAALGALALAVVTVIAPSALPPVLATTFQTVTDRIPPLVLTMIVVALGSWYAVRKLRTVSEAGITDAFTDREPEIPEQNHPVVGQDVNALLDLAEHSDTDGVPDAIRGEVKRELRQSAITAYQHRANADQTTAETQVDTGEWTPHRIPAAFLGGEDAPRFTLWERLRAWFMPESTFTTRVRKTAVAITEQVDGADPAFSDTQSPTVTDLTVTETVTNTVSDAVPGTDPQHGDHGGENA